MATSPLAAAIEVRRELIEDLQEHIGHVSPSTTSEEDYKLAEHLAECLIADGWVRGRPVEDES